MIEIKNLNIEFDGRKIFENFSLKITKGEKIIITGKSGRGKSTLLKFIMGYTAHKSGFLYFDDIKIDKNQIKDIDRIINAVLKLLKDKDRLKR